jgi:hypothetical protein
MHLLGRLTNLPAPLAAVFEALPDEPIEPTVQPEPLPASGRFGNGEVQRVVVKVLAANGPMQAADIYRAVSSLLGDRVSRDSIYSCLSTGTRGKKPRFERVALGCYRLRHDWLRT